MPSTAAGKSEKDIKNLRQEIEILRQLRHENIIQMLDAFETKTEFCVVTGEQRGIELRLRCEQRAGMLWLIIVARFWCVFVAYGELSGLQHGWT